MATYTAFKLTSDGVDLEYKAQTANLLKFTKFKLGDGNYSGNIRDLTDLVSSKMDVKIARLEVSGSGNNRKVIIGFDLDNKDVKEGFYLREIGLYAEDPETKEEKLVFYTNAGDTADYIAAGGEETVLEKLFNIELYITDVETITAEIDTSLTYVDKQTFDSTISGITTDLSSAEMDISDLQDNDSTQDTNISTLQTKTSQHDTDIQALQTKDGELQKSITDLTTNTYRKDETYSKSEVDGKVSSVYRYKGSVENKAALPKSDQVEGDVYNLQDTGMNVAWSSQENDWDDLGVTFDPSNLESEIQDLEGKIAGLSKSYNDLTDKPTINGIEINGKQQCEYYGVQRSLGYMKDITLEVAQWFDNPDNTFYYLVKAQNVTENHRANIYLDLVNQQKLTNGYTETVSNGVKIITSEKPTENITCNIEIAMIKQD